MNSFQYLQAELEKIRDYQTERSFYPILKQFLIDFAKEGLQLKQDVNVISEASSKVHEDDVGFPDLTVQIQSYGYKTLGWVEVKLPKDNLNDDKFKEQFERYTDSLENVLFTNLKEWVLYQWDDKGKAKKVAACLFDANVLQSDTKPVIEVLSRFFEGKVLELKTPKQLALALARKTRLLSKQVQETLREALANNNLSHDLVKLRNAFSDTLIADLKDHQFANMAAETIAYSFFLAALEHQKRGKEEPLTISTAIDYLPTSVPILGQLYDLFAKSASKHESIKLAVEALLEQLQKADMEKINKILSKHEVGKDPVINFYEPFLAEYDPVEREARGVYYTPKQVVDYIIRGVDYLLKEKFGKIAGIGDPDVHLLDPATGTGTFLMSAIELIHQQKQKQFGAIGDTVVRKEFIRVVENHILKHFFGFELMIAPYAIAHLKLTLLLEDLGFSFDMTKDNGKDDDDRLRIYLANTLEEPHNIEDKGTQLNLLGLYEAISDESEAASLVKSKEPIMVIVGNPPYSNFGQMNRNDWILSLLKDYKKDLKEKKINIDDDYIKFIRFAQWKIEKTGEGIIAFITNNSFIDGVTHRQMRKNLMESFDEIYIYNLHGSVRKSEVCPDGSRDENVFNIMTGVSINIFIKNKKRNPEGCKVYYQDLWGVKTHKLDEVLENTEIESTKWIKLDPSEPYFFFAEKDLSDVEYLDYWSLKDIFLELSSGVKSERDSLTIHFDKKSLVGTIKDFRLESEDQLKIKYKLRKDSRDWKLKNAIADLREHTDDDSLIKRIYYRPYDERWIWYSGKTRGFIGTPGYKISKYLLRNNLGLIFPRMCKGTNGFQHGMVCSTIIDVAVGDAYSGSGTYFAPLFIYEGEAKSVNFNIKFIDIITSEIGHSFTLGSIVKVFDYIYGILYLPQYRKKYAEQLKIDFPRIPLPSQAIEAGLINRKNSKEAFEVISRFGFELRQLHLLTHTIFADSSKWAVQVGGNKPEVLEDWKVKKVVYKPAERRVYVNDGQYFEGVDPEVWHYNIGGYQVLDKWLKDRKKAERCLSSEDIIHYCKVIVSLRETIKLVKSFE